MKKRVFLLFWLLSAVLLQAAPPREYKIGDQLWRCYSKGKVIRVADNEFRIIDAIDKTGAGLYCTLPVKPGERLSFSGSFKALNGDVEKLFLQIRFMPRKKIIQQEFSLKNNEEFKTIEVNLPTPPTGSKQAMVYIYVQPGKNELLMRDLKLQPMQVKNFDASQLPSRRKSMFLDNRTIVIIPDDGSADKAVADWLKNSPVKFKTVKNIPRDGTYSSCILIGNRNNNKLISDLYDQYHLIADGYYPGPGGYQLRTLFNPGGKKADYLLVSGSGNAETLHAIKRLANKLQNTPLKSGRMTLGFFWDIKLSADHKLPVNVVNAHTFDESEGYRTRFFGWNVLSRYMALFYATGDTKYARRFLELAFRKSKDAQAELARDPGTFKLIKDPLAGPYHYNAAMMNLYWEMIADHPVFSDQERADVTAAIFRQFLFWRDTSNGCNVYNNFSPAIMVGNRHGQWAAVSLYTAARYLDKVTPSSEYKHAKKAAENFFSSIKKYYYVMGEGGNLTWFPSGNEAVPFFMLLAGWKNHAAESGLADLYRAVETLCGNAHGKRIRYYVPLSMLRRIAYLLDDNAPLKLEKQLAEHYNVNAFRLGQSFAPARPYSNNGGTGTQKWNFIKPSSQEQPSWRMPFKDWQNGFSIASWRQDDKNGDLIIIDGHLDQISRQPLHAMTVFTLAIADLPLLAGYRNQLWARHDGLSFSSMPSSAHYLDSMSLQNTAGFVSSLDISDTLKWQRTLLKVNDFCLFADTLQEKSKQSKQYTIDAVWELAPGLEREIKNNNQVELTANDLQANSSFFAGASSSRYTVTPANGETILLAGGVPCVLFKAQQPGEKLTISFTLQQAFSGSAILRMYSFKDRGKFNVYIDDNPIQSDLDHYSPVASAQDINLGNVKLAAGKHKLTLEAAAPSAGGTMSIAFSALALQQKDARKRKGSLSFADHAQLRNESHKASVNDLLSGNVAIYTFKTKLFPGKKRTFFTLIGSRSAQEFDCCRLSDNAALLKTPEKMLAVQGKYQPLNINAHLLLLSGRMLCGIKILNVGKLFAASKAVDVKWDLNNGKLEIDAPESMTVTLNNRKYNLHAGRNQLECKIAPADQQQLESFIAALPWKKSSDVAAAGKLRAPAEKFTAKITTAAYPASMINFNGMLAVAGGKNIRIFNTDLQLQKTFTADAVVGKLAYANDSKLLLAGCEDGKVIAFDPVSGKRRWEHVSREADGLAETGAHWYLKSSFPGIYGLAAGRFAGNKENIFVGSASTLEILHSNGKLLRRFKILWGPIRHFELYKTADKSCLLLSQFYPGSDYLTRFDDRFNSKIGYHLPPAGKLYFANWMGINRTGISALDLDNDGKIKIVSGLNGVWNRIIVWDEEGKPLREVSFGIGDSLKVPPYGRERMEKRSLYDTLIVRSSNKNCIAAATGEALILFDNHLKKLWSNPLPEAPLVSIAANNRIISGLRNGQLCFYDLNGKLQSLYNNSHPWAAMLIYSNALFAADSQGNIYKFTL